MSNNLVLDVFLALGQTLYMTAVSAIVAGVVGFFWGAALLATGRGRISAKPVVYAILDAVVNIGRSVPFIILLIAVLPFTRLIAGTTIGSTAAIVPLSLAGAPFFARVVESALKESGSGLVEAGLAMGASKGQIIFRILFPEARASLAAGFTLLVVNMIGYGAMAGAVGGGGLGALAYNYGFLRFNNRIILITVIVLVALVQILQTIGNRFTRKLLHKAI